MFTNAVGLAVPVLWVTAYFLECKQVGYFFVFLFSD